MGSIGDAISPPKLKKHYINKPLATRLEYDYVDALEGLEGTGKKASTDFAAALALGTPEATRIQADDISNLGTMVKGGMDFDPLRYYNDILNAKVGGPSGIKSFIPDLMGASSADQARRNIGLGISGTTNTAYNTRTGLAQLGSSLAPILSNIYANTGAEAAGAAGQRLANIGSVVNLMRERAGVPDRLANRSLLPFQAEADILGSQLGLAGNLGDISKANFAGFEQKRNPWAKVAEASGNIADQSIQMLASMYSSYGGGSPYGGSPYGGGKPSSPPPRTNTYSVAPPPSYPGGWF